MHYLSVYCTRFVFHCCFWVIEARGGTWFRTPCPLILRDVSQTLGNSHLDRLYMTPAPTPPTPCAVHRRMSSSHGTIIASRGDTAEKPTAMCSNSPEPKQSVPSFSFMRHVWLAAAVGCFARWIVSMIDIQLPGDPSNMSHSESRCMSLRMLRMNSSMLPILR